jgi:hypothetical protein
MEISLSNPILLVAGGIAFLALIYFWNKSNSSKQSKRRRRNFRSNYHQKKGKEKTE